MPPGPVLLTGASGLLGHWLRATAPHDVEVIALTHRRGVRDVPSETADLRDPGAVRSVLRSVMPAFVIHAAYAKDRASIVDATRHIVEAAREVGAELALISTDAVFAGDGIDRDEAATPDATWDYGRWKTEAEQAVIAASESAVVVRLPLLVSTDPDDDMSAEIRAAAEAGAATRWFSDEMRRPAFASDVAEAIWRIVLMPAARRRGSWHLAGPERLSRYELALRLAARLGLTATAVERGTRPPGSDRPRDIAFTDARARAAIGWKPTVIG